MIENKRFMIDDDGIVTDMFDLSMYIDNEDCCEKLNELAEENKDLEEARSYYQENFLTMKTERNQLKEENKQLQSKLEQYERIMSDFDVSCFDELRTIMEQGCGV